MRSASTNSRNAWNYGHRNNHCCKTHRRNQTTPAAPAAHTRYLSSPAAATLHGKTQGFVLRLPPHNTWHAPFMQPFQCDLQPQLQETHGTTHTGTTIVAKHIEGTKRPQPHPPLTRGTFHRRLQPLYTKNTRFRAPASSPTHHLPSSPLPFLATSHRHRLTSSPLPFLITSHRHQIPSSPPPFVHFPSSPLPFLTTSLRHHFPSSPLPYLTTSLRHHFPSSPLPFVTTSLHHHFPSSPLPFVTNSLRHHFPSSPLPIVTTSHRHHLPSSPPSVIASLFYVMYHPSSRSIP